MKRLNQLTLKKRYVTFGLRLPIRSLQKEEEIPIQTQTEDVHIQSDEVPTVDQATTIPETPEVELPTEPVVEITPTAEEVQNAIGEEKFVEDEHVEVDEEVTQNGNGIPHEVSHYKITR